MAKCIVQMMERHYIINLPKNLGTTFCIVSMDIRYCNKYARSSLFIEHIWPSLMLLIFN